MRCELKTGNNLKSKLNIHTKFEQNISLLFILILIYIIQMHNKLRMLCVVVKVD